MSPEASIPYRVERLEKRVERIDEKLGPLGEGGAVLASEMGHLAEEVKGLKRAFYSFAFAVTSGSILFAFSVLTLIAR